MRTGWARPAGPERTPCYIAGDWQPASDSSRIRAIDPASGELITDVANGTVEDGLAAVTAAERARPAWAATPPRESPQ